MSKWSRLKRFIETSDSDHCTVCHKAFAHNSHSYSGIMKNGSLGVVSDCCRDQIQELYAVGLYLAKNRYEFMKTDAEPKARYSAEEIKRGVSALQEAINIHDEEELRIRKMAGLDHLDFTTHTAPNSDDRDWFRQHPERSHRVRLATLEEKTAYRKMRSLPDCENYDIVALVRQIEPGSRARLYCYKPSHELCPITEDESRALFDYAAQHYQNRDTALSIDIEQIDTEESRINVAELPITKLVP